ncbi:MAG: ABC transporter ATP-binding protein [Planctomycetes bacterium]|nr:ABC transporter ATP-binding protein [Planctomycetota bacterium]
MSLRADHLNFAYSADLPILNDLCFELLASELHFIVGANGSGKSTLLRCLSQDERCAYLPQTISSSLPFSVSETIELGARLSKTCNVEQLAAKLDVNHLLKRRLSQLSGGERQRVLVAAVLAEQSEYLLLDEPSCSLDVHHQVQLFRYLKTVCLSGVGIAVVCHDINIASCFADKISLLHHGKIIECGTPSKVINQQNMRLVFSDDVKVINVNNQAMVVPVND